MIATTSGAKNNNKSNAKNDSKLSMLLFVFRAIAASAVAFGALVALGFPHLFDYMFKKQMLLVNGSVAFTEWSSPSNPTVNKFYLFSIDNPEGILTKGEKPTLVQMGPYTFMEKEEKIVEAWHDSNSSVTYKIKRTYKFDRGSSVGDLDQMITTINVPMLASAYSTRDNYWARLMLSSVFASIGNPIFINRTVGEMLFDGYPDEIGSLAEMMGQVAEGGPPMDRFGWFYKRNGTTWGDGLFNMYTGAGDINLLGEVNTWNDQTRTNFEGECGEIKGSANGFYPPGYGTKTDHLDLFSQQICRTISFQYKEDALIDSIATRVFKLDQMTFANMSVNPDNWCFNNNLPTGVQNSTMCKMESPAFLSFPHFYLADTFYADQFELGSINPKKELHESRISLEPTTSIPLEVIIRMQINLRLDPVPDIPELANLPKGLYLPTFWFEALAVATPDSVSSVGLLLSISAVGRTIGAIVCFLGISALSFIWMINRRREPTKSMNDSSTALVTTYSHEQHTKGLLLLGGKE